MWTPPTSAPRGQGQVRYVTELVAVVGLGTLKTVQVDHTMAEKKTYNFRSAVRMNPMDTSSLLAPSKPMMSQVPEEGQAAGSRSDLQSIEEEPDVDTCAEAEGGQQGSFSVSPTALGSRSCTVTFSGQQVEDSGDLGAKQRGKGKD